MFEIRQYRVALMDQSAVYRLKGWVGGLIFPPAGILSHGGLSDMTGLDVEPIDLSDGLIRTLDLHMALEKTIFQTPEENDQICPDLRMKPAWTKV